MKDLLIKGSFFKKFLQKMGMLSGRKCDIKAAAGRINISIITWTKEGIADPEFAMPRRRNSLKFFKYAGKVGAAVKSAF